MLDTNVVSELRKGPKADARVLSWIEGVESAELFVSVLVIGEVRNGIERLRRRQDQHQADILELWLEATKELFAERVIAVSSAIAERWGALNAVRPRPVIDGLLAATALEHDLTLVTRDSGTLADTGVRVLDPWA